METAEIRRRFLDYFVAEDADVAKIEAGRMTVEPTLCSPFDVVSEVVGLMEIPAKERGLDLIVRNEGLIPEVVRTDPTRLRQILINLVGNAIKFTDDGEVTVLTLAGQITLDDGDLAFRRCIHDLIDRGRTKLVVNLGDVTYIDSAGVGMLAAKLKTVREKGGDLRLARLTSRSQRLFGMMKLILAFETFEDEPAAVKSYVWTR